MEKDEDIKCQNEYCEESELEKIDFETYYCNNCNQHTKIGQTKEKKDKEK